MRKGKIIFWSWVFTFIFCISLITLINLDIKHNKPAKIIDVTNHREYNIKFKSDCVIIDGVEYTIDIKTLAKELDIAKHLDPKSDSISSDCILKDDYYSKYDIISEDNRKYVIFYKFRDENDSSYGSPVFNLNDVKQIFDKDKRMMNGLE